MKRKTITLSLETWDKIQETIDFHQDEGPPGEGWKSPELKAACVQLDAELEAEPVKTPAKGTVRQINSELSAINTDLDGILEQMGFNEPEFKEQPKSWKLEQIRAFLYANLPIKPPVVSEIVLATVKDHRISELVNVLKEAIQPICPGQSLRLRISEAVVKFFREN